MAIQTINNGESGSAVRNKLNSNFSELAASGGGGSPGGADTQVQFNDGGVFGGASGWTWNKATNTMTLASGTQTANNPAQTITQTWNNAGATFTGLRLNVTDTASNSASLLADFQVGGVSRFNVTKAGNVAIAGSALTAPGTFSIGTTANDSVRLIVGGIAQFFISSTQARIGNYGIHFSSDASANNPEFAILRDAANTLAQRNGANAQTSRIYGSFTDAGNYERGSISSNASGLVIGHEAAGTGTARPLLFQTGGATRLAIGADGTITTESGYVIGDAAYGILRTTNAPTVITSGTQIDLNSPYVLLNHITFGRASQDTRLMLEGSGLLGQRGDVQQTYRIYGTFTNASNHRRLSLGMSTAGVAEIKPEGAGTGASGNVLHISGLPTANPGPGILWNDAGTVKVGT